jgi:PAS domain-containing protein
LGQLLDANLESVFQSGKSLREIVAHGKEKATFPVTLSPFGKELALVLIEAPATETAGGLNELWQSHFFTNANEAALVTTGEGDVLEANPEASELLGQSPSALTRSNIFQLVSKAPGAAEEFTLDQLRGLESERLWQELLSVSPSGPIPVSANLIPVKDSDGKLNQFVAIIQPKQVATLSEADILELSQSQFRSQLQTITSLFSIAPDNSDSNSFITWLIRLKVLAESMTSSKRVGIIYLLRDIADQVSSVAGKGLGPREVVISGSSSLTIDNEIATPFALLAGEVMSMGVCGNEKGPGPAIYIDVERCEGNIQMTAKPGEDRQLVNPDGMENTKVIEILVEQIRGKISIGVGDDENQPASIRLTFPCQQT